MTATSSSSSIPPDQQPNISMDATGASPYGTRSRNRTGNPRPNYAEDREPEMEYEWSSTKRPHAGLGPSMPNIAQSGDGDKPSAANARRSSTTAPVAPPTNNRAALLTVQKDHLPGMSSFSLNPEPNTAPPAPSRKRKAPGNGTITSHASSTVTQTPAPGISRKTAGVQNPKASRETNLMTFENCQCYLKNGKLRADDGTVISVNDQVYLVCEPPGEPYYLARVMEFLHIDNDVSQPVDALRVNWYLRPRDMQRKVNDTRVVFASMQSDTCPITSLRGKCHITHRNDIQDLDQYRKIQDSFWYEKLFDRYIHRYYEVIPTSQVINVPAKVKKVLDERWKFVIVEIGRGKELTSAIKSCKRCQGYCASNDSVDCAVCKNTYHMNCVRPPLLKKPARGFGWSCGPCSRKQEKKLEARNTPIVGEKATEGEEEEIIDEEEDEHADPANGRASHDADTQNSGPRPPTAEQIAQAKLWPYRYLGIHCRVEDALDYDDRIYPRASSRLGPKHQANVQVWQGQPVEFVKPADIRKKYMKGTSHKKDAKLTKETIAALEADKVTKEKRPKWVMDEPLGYVARGEDYPVGDPRNTAQLSFRMPEMGETSSRGGNDSDDRLGSVEREKVIDDYMARARDLAPTLIDGLLGYNTNFLDKALELLVTNGYQGERALQQLRKVTLKDLKEPELSPEDWHKFVDGVRRYGSELRAISRHIGKHQKHGTIVRIYYMWKKTPLGKQVWGNYEGRKGKKQAQQADSKLADDVADDVDDSAFDNQKASMRKRGFECKFCATRHSPQWRRAPATAPGTTVPIDPSLKNSRDKNVHLMLALCQRCAMLWRRYGIQWENENELAKKVASGGGRAWRRRIDEELLIELVSANEVSSVGMSTTTAAAAASVGVEIPLNLTIHPGQDGPKKKQKIVADNPVVLGPQNSVLIEPPKKKIIEKPPEPALVPEPPRIRLQPCAVCNEFEPLNDEHLECKYCRLTVHRNCYGVAKERPKETWTCDMCANDSGHQLSTTYDCVLCSVRAYTDTELMEPPKVSHKKKTDREREKERLERELVVTATELYHRDQKTKGRPEQPRQPLKRTSGNNWVHVVCAIFHPEIKFVDPQRLEPAEGFGAVPIAKYNTVCKLCKKIDGACVSCSHCQGNVHPTCAQQYGGTLGFDLNPVKSSRSHVVNTVDMGGEVGNATAVVYCRDHPPKHPVHLMSEQQDTLNALQVFARSHKQADTSLTGTLRKALIVDAATKTAAQLGSAGANYRGSNSTIASGAVGISSSAPTTRSSRVSPSTFTVKSDEVDEDGDRVVHLSEETPAELDAKECAMCGTEASPKWHEITSKVVSESKAPTVLESAAGPPEVSSQPSDTLTNGCVNGNGSDSHSDFTGRPVSSSQVEPAPVLNGDFGRDEAEDSRASDPPPTHSSNGVANGGQQRFPSGNDINQPPKFYCHKCHLRKLREPTPPPTPTPPSPEPLEPEAHSTPEPEQPSPQINLIWPSTPQPPTQEPYHGWPNQAGQNYHGPERASNGVVPHSPPVVAPPPPQHYPPPSLPPQYPEPGYRGPTPTYRDTRGVLHRGLPPQNYVPHLVNGVPAEPPSFQYRRDSSGNLYQVPYVPPAMRGPHVPPPQHPMRSPSIREHGHGPHGPPEAAENPFAVPNISQSARGPYAEYGSPPPRARTPPQAPSSRAALGPYPDSVVKGGAGAIPRVWQSASKNGDSPPGSVVKGGAGAIPRIWQSTF
ncbi:MAG: putative PHD type zinc finger protein with BAH domain-containing protein [Alectoria sarmentosa]|nr:MAG: putative PHD type zinc finger protein with BAH domain-containing protein [Alectoria sarmentosa]